MKFNAPSWLKMDQDGQTYTVCYIGMPPENTATREYYDPESTLKNSELVRGKQITLYKDVFVTDQPDRMLR